MNNQLFVMINSISVGSLWLDERQRFCFQYDAGWLAHPGIPLSLSLPLRPEPFLDDLAHPYFANLLPESRLRELIARNLGISVGNDFGLLERIGGECAGAVTITASTNLQQQEGSYQPLSSDDLNRVIAQLPQTPLLAGQSGIRLSLAGAQNKLPIHYDGQIFSLCYGSAASTHIIKPAIKDLDNTVENEAFCMALARLVGLNVPDTFIHEHQGIKLFVISRYDRLRQDNAVIRLHQEDFCQALGVLPEYKYELEGGPSIKDCFNLLRTNSRQAARDLLSLLDWVLFNWLIGNSDSHAKNLSLLLLPDGLQLAPFYDLLSTRIYAHYGVSERLAMKIGGQDAPNELRLEQWEQLAEDTGIKPALIKKRLGLLVQKLSNARMSLFKDAFAGHRCDALHRLMELMGQQEEIAMKRVVGR